MRGNRRIALAMSIVAAGGLGAATSASAGVDTSVPAKLRIFKGYPPFSGKVSSREQCQVDRKVSLYRERQGPDKLLGTDRSSQSGSWHVTDFTLKSGVYYAKVKRVTYGGMNAITCRSALSRKLSVD